MPRIFHFLATRLTSGLLIVSLVVSLGLLYNLQAKASGPGNAWFTNNSGTNWSGTPVDLGESNIWSDIDSSTNGSNLVASSGSAGHLWTSTDSGATWTQRTEDPLNWISVASSGDGTKLVAVSENTRYATSGFWISEDSGATWTQSENANLIAAAGAWRKIDMSADGETLLAGKCCGTSRLWISTDGGETWSTTNNGAYSWDDVAVSADGSTLAGVNSVGNEGSVVHVSTNNGASWTPKTVSEEDNGLTRVSMSDDGTSFVAFSRTNTFAAYSTNQGDTWTEITGALPADTNWKDMDASADGSIVYAVISAGKILKSTDSGASWTALSGSPSYTWLALAVSADGTQAAALSSGAALPEPDPSPTPSPTASPTPISSPTPSPSSAIPNNGDANNDGIQDSVQENIFGTLSPVNEKYVVLESASACTIPTKNLTAEAAQTVEDPAFSYPAGLIDFTLESCGAPGYTTTVTLYYWDTEKTDFTLRKFNPTTKGYSTIDSATITEISIDNRPVIKASYQVTDGGELDQDGIVNGKIVDPAGLGVVAIGAPNTGLR